MKLIFMGTPEFAVDSLQRVLDDGHEVLCVFTQPDKPKGRGYQMIPPPVKELALRCHIPVEQPTTLRDEALQQKIRALSPDVIVVVAYGKILPPAVLEIPKYGCINVHASLLPKYRGAGPIQWSVINGETLTGVTTMYMGEGLDTGDMILKESIEILPDETAGELHDRLKVLGAQCLSQTLRLLEAGNAPRIPQDDMQASYAPMLRKAMGEIDFAKPAAEVYNLIRGLSPWPGAYTHFGEQMIKIHEAKPLAASGKPGTLLDAKRFIVGFAQGSLEFTTVQPQGGKRMNGADYLRGKRLAIGAQFGIPQAKEK